MGAAKNSPELEALKKQAKEMGITFSPNVGLESLKAKIQAAGTGLSSTLVESENKQVEEIETKPEKKLSPAELKIKLRHDMLGMKRYKVTCLDPSKQDLDGEWIIAGNALVGTVKKYVPYKNVPWFIPKILVNAMKERTYLSLSDTDGTKPAKTESLPMYAMEEMPMITEQELKQLATEQRSGNRID